MACKKPCCKDYEELRRMLRDGSKNQLRKYVKGLFERLVHTEDDLNYRRSILDGSWPSAIEQLEVSLEKAEGIRREKPDLYDTPRTRKYVAAGNPVPTEG